MVWILEVWPDISIGPSSTLIFGLRRSAINPRIWHRTYLLQFGFFFFSFTILKIRTHAMSLSAELELGDQFSSCLRIGSTELTPITHERSKFPFKIEYFVLRKIWPFYNFKFGHHLKINRFHKSFPPSFIISN